MTYGIKVHAVAVADMENACAFIADRSEQAAERMADHFDKAIASLSEFPRRCPIAPESRRHPQEVRQLLVDNYRMLFVILHETVHILRVRHAAQRPFRPGELN